MSQIILIELILISIFCIVSITLYIMLNTKITNLSKNLIKQSNYITNIQQLLKTKSTINAITENAEIIYQNLLQNIIPIMEAIDIEPRNTPEHPLWRALGGLMDEYAKNPYVAEKLRICIKLNTEIKKNLEAYINRGNAFLKQITTCEPNGVLSSAFIDGLLGQSLTFFTQIQQVSKNSY